MSIRSLQFLFEIGPVFLGGAVAAAVFRSAASSSIHPLRDLLHLLHQRLHLLGPDAQFLDQRHRLAAADLDHAPQFRLFVLGGALVDELVEVLDVLFHQRLERPQVVRHAGEDLLLLEVLGLRDLHGAVEGKFAAVDALERLDDAAQGEIAFEDFAAEAAAGDFDLFGEVDFLVAAEQRDFAHLRQVHADRVVDLLAVAVVAEKRVRRRGEVRRR